MTLDLYYQSTWTELVRLVLGIRRSRGRCEQFHQWTAPTSGGESKVGRNRWGPGTVLYDAVVTWTDKEKNTYANKKMHTNIHNSLIITKS